MTTLETFLMIGSVAVMAAIIIGLLAWHDSRTHAKKVAAFKPSIIMIGDWYFMEHQPKGDGTFFCVTNPHKINARIFKTYEECESVFELVAKDYPNAYIREV